jgi:hypothetical protein
MYMSEFYSLANYLDKSSKCRALTEVVFGYLTTKMGDKYFNKEST